MAVDSERNLLCVTTPIGGCAAIYDLTTRVLIDDVSLPDCAGASVLSYDSQSSDSETVNVNKQLSGFIVSDGQGQLTSLSVAESTETVPESGKKAALVKGIIRDSKRHKMSFDNHLQALL